MNILCLDYGEKRVGLSYSDELGIALPLPAAIEATLEDKIEHIRREVKLKKTELILVGYPYNMNGSIGFKAREVDGFIERLKKEFPDMKFDTTDERLSSFQAQMDLDNFSKSHKKSLKAKKQHRKSGDIDSRSSALILQEYIDNASL
ncbi:MAG: Holliday junction resolvase RuvX [Opitutales bacterium]